MPDDTPCPDCAPHPLRIHLDGRCLAWLTRNTRCTCTHRAIDDARADVREALGGEAA